MKIFLLLLLLGVNGAAGVTHSMKYFYTGSSQVPNFPEFVIVGLVDEVEFVHYDSNTQRFEPKQDWMKEAVDQQYWDTESEKSLGTQQTFKVNMDILKRRFNQTGGVHIFQEMYGCEWNDETGDVKGFRQEGYDGEDFISFDLNTQSWTAPTAEAVITKNKWDNNKGLNTQRMNYLTEICPQWLKKYLQAGRSSLMRTDRPSVSLLQKSSSSPVSCFATGFYPNKAVLFWRKDGDDLHDNVEEGQILPNPDGTFQKSSDLDLSSVRPEDWGKYECVFQLSGLNDDIITKLDQSGIRTNEKSTPLIAIIVAAVVILALIIAGVGFFIYKKRSDKRPPSQVMEQLNPGPKAHYEQGSWDILHWIQKKIHHLLFCRNKK
uniref:Class I histocompatibility antigen, F10 alpha chain-like n=1 Tax=Echeneis naucrates TaxID=173247 RepID=A0A665V4J9_ECHNA